MAKISKTNKNKISDNTALAAELNIENENAQVEKAAKQIEKEAKKQNRKTLSKERKNSIKENIKKHSKRTLVTFLIMAVLGLSTGIFIGDWWNKNFGGGLTANYDDLVAADFKSDQGISDYSYYSSYLTATPTANTLQQCFLAGQYNSEQSEKYYFTSVGSIDTIVTQVVWAYKKYDKNNPNIIFYGENISLGYLTVGEATYFKSVDDITVALASKIEKQGDDYYTEYGGTIYKYDETDETKKYSDKYGSLPIIITPYIISKETVKKSIIGYNGEALGFSNFNTITIDGMQAWNFDINLHPVYSVLDYIHEVKAVGGLSEYPAFSEVKLNISLIKLDGKLYIYQIKTNETYTARLNSILAPTCTASLTQTFYYEQDFEMPQV